MVRNRATNGLGIVVLAVVVQLFLLAHMWSETPMIARVIGLTAYGMALIITSLSIAVAMLFFGDWTRAAAPHPAEALPRKPVART